MITIKINIKLNEEDKSFVFSKQNNFSYAFRKLYKHSGQLNDANYLSYIADKFGLSAYELNCLKIDVKTKLSQVMTNKDNPSKDIISIEKEIKSLKEKPKLTKKETRTLFKLNKKLVYKNKSLSKEITFGTRDLLKQISFLNNDKELNKELIIEKTSEYHDNRILSISFYGSKNDPNSNRYFNFDFENNIIIYKPFKGKKIEIPYKVASGYQKKLIALGKVKDLKLQPISVTLDRNYICISFDEELLNGTKFDEKAYFEQIKDVTDKQTRSDLYKIARDKHRESNLVDKVTNRYASIDLNPEYIGVSIMNKLDGDNFELIDSFCYFLVDLMGKSGLASTHKDSKYLTNKRKYEIGIIYKQLFSKLKHYKVGHFVMEDLNFKPKNVNDSPTEFNRKTKNVWNLNFQKALITRHCNELGIDFIEINPVYTSFIGNIIYDKFDPVNASIEIGRRGLEKYIKGNKLYSELTDTIIDTVVERFAFPDVQIIKGCKNWIELYKLVKQTEFRYRRQLNEVSHRCSRGNSTKSRWNLITFT